MASRKGPTGEIQLIPTPAEARSLLQIAAIRIRRRRCPRRRKPNMRSVRSLPAPGNGVSTSKFRLILRVAAQTAAGGGVDLAQAALLETAHRSQTTTVVVLEQRERPAGQALAPADVAVEGQRVLLVQREVLLVLVAGAEVAGVAADAPLAIEPLVAARRWAPAHCRGCRAPNPWSAAHHCCCSRTGWHRSCTRPASCVPGTILVRSTPAPK